MSYHLALLTEISELAWQTKIQERRDCLRYVQTGSWLRGRQPLPLGTSEGLLRRLGRSRLFLLCTFSLKADYLKGNDSILDGLSASFHVGTTNDSRPDEGDAFFKTCFRVASHVVTDGEFTVQKAVILQPGEEHWIVQLISRQHGSLLMTSACLRAVTLVMPECEMATLWEAFEETQVVILFNLWI